MSGVLAVALAASVTPRALLAQQPAFKSGVELVRIPVSVTQGNKPVEPGVLTAADFKLTEDGVLQQVTLLERESSPLSVVIVFDISGSMSEGTTGEFAASALRQVTTRLLPEDEVAIITFSDVPLVSVPWTRAPEIHKVALNLEVKGSTSLMDAVEEALLLVDRASNPKPVVLVISDGGENSSKTSLSRIVASRRQSETLVYAFTIAPWMPLARLPGSNPSIFDASAASRGPVMQPRLDLSVLPGIIGDSGGVEYRVRTGMEAADLARAFIDDLRFQYTIDYTPAKALDGKYRRVKVEVRKRGYRVRHRGGYLALPAR